MSARGRQRAVSTGLHPRAPRDREYRRPEGRAMTRARRGSNKGRCRFRRHQIVDHADLGAAGQQERRPCIRSTAAAPAHHRWRGFNS